MNRKLEEIRNSSLTKSWFGGACFTDTVESEQWDSYDIENSLASIFIIVKGHGDHINRKLDGLSRPDAKFTSGHVAFINAGSRISGEFLAKCQFLEITVKDEFIDQFSPRTKSALYKSPSFSYLCDMSSKAVIQELMLSMHNADPHDSLLIDGSAAFLTAKLLQAADRKLNSTKLELSKNKSNLVLSYIEDELSNNIKLEELSNLVGLSVSHFCLAFRATTNCSPHQYMITRRIEKAKALLKSTQNGLNIANLALTLGFSSQSHFTKTFKQVTGVTPLVYFRESKN
ncbi:helix-turn-helix domain-containing protein [Methylophilus sp. 3sh_L]|uniref:helix-turn-helix domain-containing protein n=1 Tax=Methylophilus sp. 3sh_L TaxID=3377114 RepID=UPI00398F3D38